jgi:hypothetical protein
MRDTLPALSCSLVTPQAPGRRAFWRASGTISRKRCPGAEDTPPEASEAPAREAKK